jgi:PEP-CTERM motif
MNRTLPVIFAATSLATATATPAMALVAVGQDYSFDWTGNCEVCDDGDELQAVRVSGTLRVTNYVLGNILYLDNFVSFSYHNSNRLLAYTINNGAYFLGNLGGTSPDEISLNGFDNNSGRLYFFNHRLESKWDTGEFTIDDYGNQSSWTLRTPTVVPEPTSWALIIAGFGLVGAAMRRHKPVVSVTYA